MISTSRPATRSARTVVRTGFTPVNFCPGHRVRGAALARMRAREALVRQFLTEAGVEDADLAAQVTLLVDGTYGVGGSRRDPAAARQAKAAVAALLAGRGVRAPK